jgi:hypothetical protein
VQQENVSIWNGTPTKRQVSKRQVSKRLVSKRLVSKRLVSKRQVYKTSGFKTSGFKTSGFKTSIEIKLKNVWFLNLTYSLNKKYRNCLVCITI